MTNKTTYVSRSIRMPKELLDRLTNISDKQIRSVNFIMVTAIEAQLDAEERRCEMIEAIEAQAANEEEVIHRDISV